MNEPIVRLEGINKWFGKLHVLRDVNLEIRPQEVVVLIGPSGSGKSTLLRTINLLEEPTEGKVFFEGQELTNIHTDLNAARTRMGMVFQQFNLFPHRTVTGNITLALEKVLGLKGDGGPGAGPGATGPRRASPTRPAPGRRNSPAGSSSGWPSPAPWRCSRC